MTRKGDTVLAAALKRYGNKICSYDAIRSNNNEGIHYSVGLSAPYKMGEDVLIDSLLLSHSAFLIRTVSGVSFFSLYYNENLEYKDIDSHIWSN